MNILKRITKAIQSGFRTIIGQPTKPTIEKPKKKSILKRMIERVRPPKPSKMKGTQKNFPTGKYSDFKTGYGQSDEFYIGKKKRKVETGTETYRKIQEIEILVDQYNIDIQEYRDFIIKKGYEYFGDLIGMNMEKYIGHVIEREKTRFSDNLYDNLRELKLDEMLGRVENLSEIENLIDRLSNNDYYDLSKRNLQYRENWIKAMYNEYGDNTNTQYIEELVRELDIDTFMVSWYNQWSGVHLQDWYDERVRATHIDNVTSFFENLKGLQ